VIGVGQARCRVWDADRSSPSRSSTRTPSLRASLAAGAAQLRVAPRVPGRATGWVSGDVEGGVYLADRQEFPGVRASGPTSGGTALKAPVVRWYRWVPTSPMPPRGDHGAEQVLRLG